MTPRLHLLLALLLGILLQTGLVGAAGMPAHGHVDACGAGTHGGTVDPYAPLSRDFVADKPPCIAGFGPDSFTAGGTWLRSPAALDLCEEASAAADPFHRFRPIYLTTHRLRL